MTASSFISWWRQQIFVKLLRHACHNVLNRAERKHEVLRPKNGSSRSRSSKESGIDSGGRAETGWNRGIVAGRGELLALTLQWCALRVACQVVVCCLRRWQTLKKGWPRCPMMVITVWSYNKRTRTEEIRFITPVKWNNVCVRINTRRTSNVIDKTESGKNWIEQQRQRNKATALRINFCT